MSTQHRNHIENINYIKQHLQATRVVVSKIGRHLVAVHCPKQPIKNEAN